MGVSYGETFYNSDSLRKVLPHYKKAFKKLLKADKSITGVISTGSSGTIIATALLLGKYDRTLYHTHINKPQACSHKGSTSGWDCRGTLVFVDDFIYKGTSLRRCVNGLKDNKSEAILKYALVDQLTICEDNRVKGVKIIQLNLE